MAVPGGVTVVSVLDSQMAPLRYVDRARTKNDITNLLAQSRSLTSKVQQLVHNTGQTESMICLTGTVPIWFQGATYNIPVSIWVPEQYPNRPPIPYVTPTRDMSIKDRHKHVDLHGVVYLPYLNQWNPSSSSLAELVTIMCSVFSEEPPVYRKIEPSPPPSNLNPLNSVGVVHNPINVSPQPRPQQNGSFLPPININNNNMNPPVPPRPNQNNLVSVNTVNNNNLNPNNGLPSYQAARTMVSMNNNISLPNNLNPSPINPPGTITNINNNSSNNNRANEPSRGQLKQQLVSQVSSSIRQCLIEYQNNIMADTENLYKSENELNNNFLQISDEMKSVDTSTVALTQTVDDLEKNIQILSQFNENYSKYSFPDQTDKIVQPKDSWTKQLMECVAEDSAIEDTLYLLDRGLTENQIDIGNFLKITRSLARKQFAARALALKIQSKLTEQNGPPRVPIPSSFQTPVPQRGWT